MKHLKPQRPQRKRRKRETLDIRLEDIDYKNISLLRKVLSGYMKILPAKRVGTTNKMQRKFAREIKRARTMALMPYIRQ